MAWAAIQGNNSVNQRRMQTIYCSENYFMQKKTQARFSQATANPASPHLCGKGMIQVVSMVRI